MPFKTISPLRRTFLERNPIGYSISSKYEDICGLLDTIALYESEPEKIPALVEKVRSEAEAKTEEEKKAKKKSKSKVTDITGDITGAEGTNSAENADAESAEKITFKGAIKGQSNILIPANLKGNKAQIMKYLYKSDIQLPTVEHSELLFEVFCNTVTDYIIIHDKTMNNVLTFFYQHGKYSE